MERARQVHRFGVLMLCSVLTACLGAGRAVSAQEADLKNPGTEPPELVHVYKVPLDKDGEFNFREFIEPLLDEAGIDATGLLDKLNLKIPVSGPLGTGAIGLINSITNGYVMINLEKGQVVVAVSRINLRRSAADFRKDINNLLTTFFSDLKGNVESRTGLYLADRTGSISAVSADQTLKAEAVVLIHGLHPVASQWDNLCGPLTDTGYQIVEAWYDDDAQPIAASADEVAAMLTQLHEKHGVERIALVTHSMGGLVARDLLTRVAYYGGLPSGHASLPDVACLIMVAPPNHGSPMAHLTFGTDISTLIEHTLSGDGLLVGDFFDGSGKAREDLVPDSPYLAALNLHRVPDHLPVTIIAGSASPFIHAQLDKLESSIEDIMKSRRYKEPVEGFSKELSALADGLGDGAVSLDSARLDGVSDFVVLPANHISLIRHAFGGGNDQEPPVAVPVILDRLKKAMPVGSKAPEARGGEGAVP